MSKVHQRALTSHQKWCSCDDLIHGNAVIKVTLIGNLPQSVCLNWVAATSLEHLLVSQR